MEKKKNESLAQLLYRLDEIEDLKIIRYTTSHPYDMSDELIEAHGKCHKLANHVHLPVQSGSNTILKRMLREYSKEHFLKLCEKLRLANPSLTLSTDIIVGFPNETEQEYEATLDLLEKAQFNFIYSYVFSPRNGTKASRIKDSLTKKIKSERLQYLQKLQLAIQEKLHRPLVGKTFRVLVEKEKTMGGVKKWQGRTNCMHIVHIERNKTEEYKDMKWHWTDIKVTSATALSCQGKLLQDHGPVLPPHLSAKDTP